MGVLQIFKSGKFRASSLKRPFARQSRRESHRRPPRQDYVDLLSGYNGGHSLSDLGIRLQAAYTNMLAAYTIDHGRNLSVEGAITHYCSLVTVINNVTRREIVAIRALKEDRPLIRELVTRLNSKSRMLRLEARELLKGPALPVYPLTELHQQFTADLKLISLTIRP